MRTSLVRKYHPRTFGEVVGQADTKRYLGELIRRGQIRKNILLHGNVGSGKTTLARLYAKALFCERPRISDGSPCNICGRCTLFENKSCEYQEVDSPNQDEHQLRATLDHLQRFGTESGLCFVFFDEAHALANTPSVFDRLLKRMEEDEDKIVYCFATTEVDRVPDALKSRVTPFEIKALSTPAAVRYMEKITAIESIKAEPEALAALAGLAKGQVRDLLQRMGQLRDVGVTLDNVQSVFGVSNTKSLVAYFDALASGDCKAQIEVFLDWNDEAHEKLRLIQLFLAAIYFVDVRFLNVVLDPVIASIPQRVRAPIVAKFRKRVDAAGVDFATFWRSMLAFWPVVVPRQTEAAIMMRIAQFHELVSVPNAAILIPVDPPDIRGPLGANSRITRPRRRTRKASNPQYLSGSAVEDIIDRAAFCVQHYGKQFDARITIWHAAFQNKDLDAIKIRMQEFGHHWTEWMRRNAPNHEVLRLSVQEVDEDRGHCTRVVAVFPDEQENEAERWCLSWKEQERDRSAGFDAVEVSRRAFTATARVRRSYWHRDSVLWLCGGLDPKEKVYDTSSQSTQTLAALLKIPKSYLKKPGQIGSAPRITASKALLPTDIEKKTHLKMPIISAFKLQRWDEIGGAWELEEHKDRLATIARRIEDITQLQAGVASSAFPQAREALFDGWSDDPFERPRSYRTWWDSTPL